MPRQDFDQVPVTDEEVLDFFMDRPAVWDAVHMWAAERLRVGPQNSLPEETLFRQLRSILIRCEDELSEPFQEEEGLDGHFPAGGDAA